MKFWSELRRRNVLRMAALYLVAAWLILQVTEVLSGLLDVPDWLGPVVLAMLVIGLPIALVISWFFEITDSGVERDPDDVSAETPAGLGERRLDFVIISMLGAAALVIAFLAWWPEPVRDRSIAVLAFDNMSDDPAQEYFSDGIAEELLGTLARIPELRVISRSSSFSFKGRNLDVPAIARQLNVAHILEGSVRKAGDRVRISAQLIEATSDTHLWAGTYERDLTAANVFEIQSQIARSIADALNTVIAQESAADAGRSPTQDLRALEAYLLGKQRMALRSKRALNEAAAYFNEAVEIDPDYAAAWLGLADASLLLSNYGHIGLDDALRVAKPALARVFELDDRLGAAYASQGLMRNLEGDTQDAVAALSHAIALDPNDAKAYHWYGDILIYRLGNPGAAIPVLQQARQLNPLSPIIAVTLGEAFSTSGNIAEGMRLYRKALEIDPSYVPAFRLLGMSYLALDDSAGATLWLDEGVRRAPDDFSAVSGKAFLYRALQEEEEAVAVARRLQALVPGNNASLVTLVSFGRDEEAIKMAEADWPELACHGDPRVHNRNVFQAMNLSLAYERVGRGECSRSLLETIRALLEAPGVNPRAFGFLDAEIHARLGNVERALATLRGSVDAGMRLQWMEQVERSPHMTAVRDTPGFRAIRNDVWADLARHVEMVREMEARGELATLAD